MTPEDPRFIRRYRTKFSRPGFLFRCFKIQKLVRIFFFFFFSFNRASRMLCVDGCKSVGRGHGRSRVVGGLIARAWRLHITSQ